MTHATKPQIMKTCRDTRNASKWEELGKRTSCAAPSAWSVLNDWFYVVTQILKVRPEAPTISRLGCQTLHLACSSHHWNLFRGDVKPAFLQGGKELESRNISCDSLLEVRKKLNISDAQILKVEGGCYGLRTAPRNSWKCLTSTL